MAGAVEVTGALELSVDEQTIAITAFGSRVRVEIGDAVPRRRSLRLIGSSFELARRLARALDARRLTLTVTRGGEPVAVLGSGVRAGALSRVLGLGRVRLVRRR